MSYLGSNVGVAGAQNITGVQKYYTGKNIATTTGGRTTNTTDLLKGDVLAMDPFGFDNGQGTDLANPTAGFLDMPLWVVTAVPNDSKRGGYITCVPLAACHEGIGPVFQKATAVAGVTLLAATDMASASVNQRYLVLVTGSTTNGTQIVDNTVKAVAGTTYDSNSTAARVDGSSNPLVVFPVQ